MRSLGIVSSARVAPSGSAYAAAVLADSPLVHWRFGESSGTIAADNTGNGRTGTYAGTPTLGVTGLVGDSDTAVQFNGTSNRVSAAYAAWMAASSFSFDAVIKPNSVSGNREIATRASVGNVGWLFRTEGTNLFLYFNTNGIDQYNAISATGVIAANTRYHVGFSYDSATVTRKIYVNGSQVGTGTGNAPFAATSGLAVGSWYDNNVEWFSGVIDEPAYYGTALSAGRFLDHAQKAGLA